MGDGSLGRDLGRDGGKTSSHALQDLAEDKRVDGPLIGSSVKHEDDSEQADEQPDHQHVLMDIRFGSSLLDSILTDLEALRAPHDGTGDDTEDRDRDAVSGGEVCEAAVVPAFGDDHIPVVSSAEGFVGVK